MITTSYNAARARYARACKLGATTEVLTELRRDMDTALAERRALQLANGLDGAQRNHLAWLILKGDGDANGG